MTLQAPGGFKLDPLQETKWISDLELSFLHAIVAYAHLGRDDAAEQIPSPHQNRHFGVSFSFVYQEKLVVLYHVEHLRRHRGEYFGYFLGWIPEECLCDLELCLSNLER